MPGLTPLKAQQLGQEILDLVRMQQARSTSRGPVPLPPLPRMVVDVTGGGRLPAAAAGDVEVHPAVQFHPLAKLGSTSSHGSSSGTVAAERVLGDAPAATDAAAALREEGDGDNHRPAPAVEFDIDAFFAAPAVPPLPLPPPPPPSSEAVAAPASPWSLGRSKLVVAEPPLPLGNSDAHLGGHKRVRPQEGSKVPSNKRAKAPPLTAAAAPAVSERALEIPPAVRPRPAFDEAAFFYVPGVAVASRPNPLAALYPGMSQLPAAAAAALPPPVPRRKAVRAAKTTRKSPASAASVPQDGDGGSSISPSGGRFLERMSDAALKQYSREEDRWILDQVASGVPEGEVAVTLRRSRNAIVRRVRLLIARATGTGTGGGGGGCGVGGSSRGIGTPSKSAAPWPHSRSKARAGASNATPFSEAVPAADAAEASSASGRSTAPPAVPPGGQVGAPAVKGGAAPAAAGGGGTGGGVPHAVGAADAATEAAAVPPPPPAIDPSEAAAVRAILSARAAAAVARSTTSLPQHLLDPLIKCIRMGSGSSASSAEVAGAQAGAEIPGN